MASWGGRWHWVGWEQLGSDRRTWHSPCPRHEVTRTGAAPPFISGAKGAKAAAPSKSLALGKLSTPPSSLIAGRMAPTHTPPPDKVGCAGWGLSPRGAPGECCDPLGGQGCAVVAMRTGPQAPGCPPGPAPGRRARLGGSASAVETSSGSFCPRGVAQRGSGRWANAALLPSCPQKPGRALP